MIAGILDAMRARELRLALGGEEKHAELLRAAELRESVERALLPRERRGNVN